MKRLPAKVKVVNIFVLSPHCAKRAQYLVRFVLVLRGIWLVPVAYGLPVRVSFLRVLAVLRVCEVYLAGC